MSLLAAAAKGVAVARLCVECDYARVVKLCVGQTLTDEVQADFNRRCGVATDAPAAATVSAAAGAATSAGVTAPTVAQPPQGGVGLLTPPPPPTIPNFATRATSDVTPPQIPLVNSPTVLAPGSNGQVPVVDNGAATTTSPQGRKAGSNSWAGSSGTTLLFIVCVSVFAFYIVWSQRQHNKASLLASSSSSEAGSTPHHYGGKSHQSPQPTVYGSGYSDVSGNGRRSGKAAKHEVAPLVGGYGNLHKPEDDNPWAA